MAITREALDYVADLARIELQPKEIDRLSVQLQDILDFIDTLKKLDVNDVEPTSHILQLQNVLRHDSIQDSITAENALRNAPARNGDLFAVPKIIE